MPGLKHNGYAGEKEHRFFMQELEINGKTYPNEIPTTHKFMTNNRQRVKSEKFKHKTIREIWIGPCSKKAASELHKILDDFGYDTKNMEIKKSELPYRNEV